MTKKLILINLLVFLPLCVLAQNAASQIDWIDYENAATLAKNNNQKILLFMEADWCSVCKRMKREVFPDEQIQTLINDYFLPVRIDIESENKIVFDGKETTKKKLSKDLGVYATPTIILLEENESVIGNNIGFSDVNDFKRLLTFIYKEEYLHSEFK